MNNILQAVSYNLTQYSTVIENLILASICGIGILAVFNITYRKISVSRNFTYTLILLPPVSCMIALGISNNIVIAAGMLGSLSIIRFRNSLKETKDLVFIFWAVTAGITCGLSLRRITVIWCCIVAGLALAISYFSGRRCHGTLAVRTSGDSEGIERIFNEYAVKYDLKYKNMDESSDLLYECKYKKELDKEIAKTICERIMLIDGVISVKFIRMS